MTDETHSAPLPEEERYHSHVRRMAWGWWLFAAIALFYLLTEHQAQELTRVARSVAQPRDGRYPPHQVGTNGRLPNPAQVV